MSVRVLYVDADPELSALAGRALERERDVFEVVTESSAEDALDRLADEGDGIDCVVSDYSLPGADGLAFLDAVRARRPDLPFLLFTGEGSESVAAEAISKGATDYLQKTGGEDQYAILANRVRNAVAKARAERDKTRAFEAIETANEGIGILDDEGRFVYVNEAYADVYGYERDELVDEHWEILYHDEDVEDIYDDVLPRTFEDGKWRGVTRGKRKDGTTIVEDHSLAAIDDSGLVCTVRDVTDRKRRERRIEALHEATRRLVAAETVEDVAEITAESVKETLGYSNNVVRLVDEEGEELRPVAVTTEARSVLGDRPVYPVGEAPAGRAFARGETLLYEDVQEIDDEYDRGDVRAAMYVPIGEHGTLSISGQERDVFDDTDVHLADIFAANAETALSRVEQAQRLRRQNERLDEFARIVAHDLQNPLNVAVGNARLVERECDSDRLEAVTDALDRMSQIVEETLALARSGRNIGERERVDLARLAERCWGTVDSGDAELRLEDPPAISADPNRLRHLLENLFRNGVEHGGDGVTIRLGALDGGFYVEDDGPGVPEDEREAIFDAGYSSADDGTGFGLAIVERVVDAHGWEIAVTDGRRGGSRFEITGVESTP